MTDRSAGNAGSAGGADNLDGVQRVADLVNRAQSAAALAGALARRAGAAEAADQARVSFEACRDAQRRLEAMGAILAGPEGMPAPDRFAAVPLRLLDTPAGRELLAALDAAAEAAGALDRERGWTDPDGSPCGWAESVGGLAEKLRLEIDGPTGRE